MCGGVAEKLNELERFWRTPAGGQTTASGRYGLARQQARSLGEGSAPRLSQETAK